MLVITATSASTTLVQSQVPPSPTSITATSTASSANQAKVAAVSSSKRVGRSCSRCSRRASEARTSTNGLVVDRLAVACEPLVHSAEVGAGVGADRRDPARREQCGHHRRRRSFAVGAGDVQQPGRRVRDRRGGPISSRMRSSVGSDRREGMDDSKSMCESSHPRAWMQVVEVHGAVTTGDVVRNRRPPTDPAPRESLGAASGRWLRRRPAGSATTWRAGG